MNCEACSSIDAYCLLAQIAPLPCPQSVSIGLISGACFGSHNNWILSSAATAWEARAVWLLSLSKSKEALRRDLRSEKKLAKRDSGWEIWHQRNVQLNLRLLEVLNPKGPDSSGQIYKDPAIKPGAAGIAQPMCCEAGELPERP